MRFVATGGGTGGHVYPALSALEALIALPEAATRAEDVLWVGSRAGVERSIVGRTGHPYAAVSTGPLHGANVMQAIQSVGKILAGIWQAASLIGRWRPAAVLATGGFVSVPVVVAAWLRRVPVLLYLPDMEPGMAVKALARIARRVAVSFEPAAAFFGDKSVVTGYPVRQALFEVNRDEARQSLRLYAELPVLLVMGGSRGARSINQAVQASLSALLAEMEIIHVTGSLDYESLLTAKKALPATLRDRYWVHEYLHDEMVLALKAADLVVARSGAATLGEFPAAGLPAILAPYPYAGRHQEQNAAYLQAAGAALVIDDDRLADELQSSVLRLLRDGETLKRMGQAARAASKPDAARRIAQELVSIGEKGHHGGSC